MPDGQETSLEDLRKLIEENERALQQAKRLLQWLEAHAANESIRRMVELSKDDLQCKAQALAETAPDGSGPELNPIIPSRLPPAQGSQLSC